MEAGHGPISVWVERSIIRARNARGGLLPQPVGYTMSVMENLGDARQVYPSYDWLDCDGQAYWRSDYPELAPVCRRFTSWFRWNVMRQFRVPDLRGTAHVGVDFGGK